MKVLNIRAYSIISDVQSDPSYLNHDIFIPLGHLHAIPRDDVTVECPTGHRDIIVMIKVLRMCKLPIPS